MGSLSTNQAFKGQEFDLFEIVASMMGGSADLKDKKPSSVEDCTITPRFLLSLAQMETFQRFISEAQEEAQKNAPNLEGEDLISDICDRFAVKVGVKMLEFLPNIGRVSIEIDPELSFDTEASFQKTCKLVGLFDAQNVQKEKVLVKLVSTWESIKASKKSAKEGINCNLTSLLSSGSLPQSMCHSWACREEWLDTNSVFEHFPEDARKLRDFVSSTVCF